MTSSLPGTISVRLHSDADVLEHQIAKALWSQTAGTLLGGLVIMGITTALLWGTVSTQGLLTWLALTGAINAEGWWARRKFPGSAGSVESVKRWRLRFSLGATTAGLIWGSTLWLLAPRADWPLYILCVVCASAAFGALMHNAVSFGIIVASAAGTLIPSAAYILLRLEWTGPHLATSGLILSALLFIVHFAYGHSRLVRASMLLGIENDRLRKAAERAATAKSRFLASASHDLRQPMATVGLLVGLARDSARTPEMIKILDKADESVAAMETLLTGLLDLSRLESGTVKVNWQAIYLQDIFSAIHTHESTAAGRKGLRLSFRPTSALVMTDPMLLERSVRNLVSNAIRYTERGGVLVGVRRRAGGQRLLIEVWDTGIGIPTTDQAAIFDEFVQLGDVPHPQGLGLGLAIIRRSIDMLGYRLALRSVPGRGSCFRIELPALTDQTAHPLARMKEEETKAQCLAGQVVVLIEDDHTLREALQERLDTWGAEVHAFADLPELRVWLDTAALAPTIVISDGHLPSGSGVDAIDLVRCRHGGSHPALIELLITGHIGSEEAAQARSRGVPLLQKPFRAGALLASLRAASDRAASAHGQDSCDNRSPRRVAATTA